MPFAAPRPRRVMKGTMPKVAPAAAHAHRKGHHASKRATHAGEAAAEGGGGALQGEQHPQAAGHAVPAAAGGVTRGRGLEQRMGTLCACQVGA